MARASSGLDGAMAPTLRGRANSPRRNRNCSSKGETSVLLTALSYAFLGDASRTVAAGPEVLQLGKETLGLGMRAMFAGFLELAEQFFLLLGEFDRGLDGDFDIEVALHAAAAHHRHAFAAHAELAAGLRSLGNGHL